MNYILSEFQASHLSDVAELERVCFSTPWTEDGLREELSNPQSHFLTALCADEAVGYIGVQEICGEAYITNIAVLPRVRQCGIATALLHSAIQGAKARGCDFITLEVREHNAPAKALYEKAGFVPMGIRKNFYRFPTENAVIYTKTLKDEQA